MARKKKKNKEIKLSRGKPIDPILSRARNLRASLLRRVSLLELKESTPTIKELHRWLNHDNYLCYYCLKSILLEEAQIDHKIPIGRNGNNMLENLCISCADCNTAKGILTSEEFRELVELLKTWEEVARINVFTRLKRGGNFGFKK